jgi:hypothetical protein
MPFFEAGQTVGYKRTTLTFSAQYDINQYPNVEVEL